MNEPYPPVVTLPDGLSDEAAATFLQFLHELTERFEHYYAAQLHRYYHQTEQQQPKPGHRVAQLEQAHKTLEREAGKNDDRTQPRAKLNGRNHCRAKLQWRISTGVL